MGRADRGGWPGPAPGPAGNPFQVIDARDLAAFIMLLAHGGATGAFRTVSPTPPFSFGDFLATVASAVGRPGTELAWISAAALTQAGVTAADLPLGRKTRARTLPQRSRPRPCDRRGPVATAPGPGHRRNPRGRTEAPSTTGPPSRPRPRPRTQTTRSKLTAAAGVTRGSGRSGDVSAGDRGGHRRRPS